MKKTKQVQGVHIFKWQSVFFPSPCGVFAITSHNDFMFIKSEYLELTWCPETTKTMTTFSKYFSTIAIKPFLVQLLNDYI